jgi:MbtH protein
VTNPFEDPNGTYHVLTNSENQHSLWPTFAEIPAGWQIALENGTREACLAYVEQNWRDQRPKTLQDRMG